MFAQGFRSAWDVSQGIMVTIHVVSVMVHSYDGSLGDVNDLMYFVGRKAVLQ